MFKIFEAILLVAALSADSFAVSLGCGVSKVKLGALKSLIISFISTMLFGLSIVLGDILGVYIHNNYTKMICFALLFALAIIKLTSDEDEKCPHKLTLLQTFIISLSMSIDGVAAGIGIGISVGENLCFLLIASALVTFCAIFFGNMLGFALSRRLTIDFNMLSGLIFLLLAAAKLML